MTWPGLALCQSAGSRLGLTFGLSWPVFARTNLNLPPDGAMRLAPYAFPTYVKPKRQNVFALSLISKQLRLRRDELPGIWQSQRTTMYGEYYEIS